MGTRRGETDAFILFESGKVSILVERHRLEQKAWSEMRNCGEFRYVQGLHDVSDPSFGRGSKWLLHFSVDGSAIFAVVQANAFPGRGHGEASGERTLEHSFRPFDEALE